MKSTLFSEKNRFTPGLRLLPGLALTSLLSFAVAQPASPTPAPKAIAVPESMPRPPASSARTPAFSSTTATAAPAAAPPPPQAIPQSTDVPPALSITWEAVADMPESSGTAAATGSPLAPWNPTGKGKIGEDPLKKDEEATKKNAASLSRGLSGTYSGLVAGNTVLVAGGSNFPDAYPWQGGQRKYHSQIHALRQEADGKFKWQSVQGALPAARANGCSLTLKDGILCIGGADEQGCHADCFLLQFNAASGAVKTEPFPALPVPLAYATAARAGDLIFVAGGIEQPNGLTTKRFYLFDLGAAAKGQPAQWRELPTWDGPSRSLAVSTALLENGTPVFYLFSGRSREANEAEKVLKDAHRFDLQASTWTKLPDIALPREAARGIVGASALPYGAEEAIIFGGDDGTLLSVWQTLSVPVFSTTEQEDAYKKLNEVILANHPGYSRDILLYNTRRQTWRLVGSAPEAVPVVSSIVALKQNQFLVVSGESKPGARSPKVILSEWPLPATTPALPPVPGGSGLGAGTPPSAPVPALAPTPTPTSTSGAAAPKANPAPAAPPAKGKAPNPTTTTGISSVPTPAPVPATASPAGTPSPATIPPAPLPASKPVPAAAPPTN